jgi:hypothetical protein
MVFLYVFRPCLATLLNPGYVITVITLMTETCHRWWRCAISHVYLKTYLRWQSYCRNCGKTSIPMTSLCPWSHSWCVTRLRGEWQFWCTEFSRSDQVTNVASGCVNAMRSRGTIKSTANDPVVSCSGKQTEQLRYPQVRFLFWDELHLPKLWKTS